MAQINFFLALLVTAILGLITIAILKPQETYKCFQRKRYQYNVTLALYMLTPTERFIFNSVLFLTLTLLTIAACLYLPEHMVIITRRIYYYCFGDKGADLTKLSSAVSKALSQNVSKAVETVSSDLGRKTGGDAAREMLSGIHG